MEFNPLQQGDKSHPQRQECNRCRSFHSCQGSHPPISRKLSRPLLRFPAQTVMTGFFQHRRHPCSLAASFVLLLQNSSLLKTLNIYFFLVCTKFSLLFNYFILLFCWELTYLQRYIFSPYKFSNSPFLFGPYRRGSILGKGTYKK